MKKIYFFVHVPKTAGTSFRKALQQNAEVNMLYDYGQTNPESTSRLIQMQPDALSPEQDIFDEHKTNVICGHVDYGKYAHCVSPDSVISIVRNPIERIVSEYQHLRRHMGFATSFTDFCKSPVQQDKQSQYLHGINPDKGALIGLTSHYKYFVEIFSNESGISMKEIAVNRAPPSDAEARLNISPSEIGVAYSSNKNDVNFFFEVARAFIKRVGSAGYNTIPSDEVAWSGRLDLERQRVVGWISCGFKDCYFVTLEVNGESRVVIALDQNRKDVFENGLTENPLCGFSYPTALLGVEPGDEICIGVLGAPGIKKKIRMRSKSEAQQA